MWASGHSSRALTSPDLPPPRRVRVFFGAQSDVGRFRGENRSILERTEKKLDLGAQTSPLIFRASPHNDQEKDGEHQTTISAGHQTSLDPTPDTHPFPSKKSLSFRTSTSTRPPTRPNTRPEPQLRSEHPVGGSPRPFETAGGCFGQVWNGFEAAVFLFLLFPLQFCVGCFSQVQDGPQRYV